MTALCCMVTLLVGYCVGRAIECSRWVRSAGKPPHFVFKWQLRPPWDEAEAYWVVDDERPCERCGCAHFRPDCYCCKRSPRPWHRVEAQA